MGSLMKPETTINMSESRLTVATPASISPMISPEETPHLESSVVMSASTDQPGLSDGVPLSMTDSITAMHALGDVSILKVISLH